MATIRPVRIDPDLYALIATKAGKEARSITKQVNYLLRIGLNADSKGEGKYENINN